MMLQVFINGQFSGLFLTLIYVLSAGSTLIQAAFTGFCFVYEFVKFHFYFCVLKNLKFLVKKATF